MFLLGGAPQKQTRDKDVRLSPFTWAAIPGSTIGEWKSETGVEKRRKPTQWLCMSKRQLWQRA